MKMETLEIETDKSSEPEATLRLGELLMSEGLLTPAQLEEAHAIS